MTFIDDLKRKMSTGLATLTGEHLGGDLGINCVTWLRDAYQDTDANIAWFGCIVRAAWTERKSVFLLSKYSLKKLILKDSCLPSDKKKLLSGSDYSRFIDKIVFRSKSLNRLREPSPFGGKERKAGVYQFNSPDITSSFAALLGANFMEEQVKTFLNEYDS